jgi:hypothetical protein
MRNARLILFPRASFLAGAFPDPADDHLGDLQVVLVHHQHVAVAFVARLGQQQQLGRAARRPSRSMMVIPVSFSLLLSFA